MAQTLQDGVRGCLYGLAVGDALGGSTEGYPPEVIRERFGGWVTDIVGPFLENWQTERPISPLHKGDGHITDDTLMTLALANVYTKLRRHLSAFDLADYLIPELTERVVYIPEFERETVLAHRLFFAEKHLVLRLKHAHADPREAGMGNVVNCGAAMYMSPVGMVNAGNPRGAYQEGIELAGAHQLSYGREAAGVMAAAVAEALNPEATVASVVATCLELAQDGTKLAVAAVTEAAQTVESWQEAIPVLREAVKPFDTVGEQYRNPALDARKPSRTKAIEELPVALGMLVATKGNYTDAVLGGVNYGRDSDSIAQMAGAIAGALHGESVVPVGWLARVAEASRRDFRSVADDLSHVAYEVFEQDGAAWQRRLEAFPRGPKQ